jgi:transcriptional regulator with XRE-family HTH domain
MERGLSQEAFAQRAGLDRTYVSGIERGRRNVAIRNVEKLARAPGGNSLRIDEGAVSYRVLESIEKMDASKLRVSTNRVYPFK